MTLPSLDSRFPPGEAERDAEVFHSFSRTVCPHCGRLVDGARIIRSGKVFLRRECPVHGRSEGLISSDADWFLRSLSFVKPGSVPLEHSMPLDRGCPHDCGLCPDHEQHSCLPVIEITDHCDMACPICIVSNEQRWEISPAEFSGIIDGLLQKEGQLDTVNISGGEPTLHSSFLELVDLARRPGISRISVSTNGSRIASDPAFCEALAARNVYVNLQLDGFDDESLRSLRGAAGLASVKRQALANLEKAGVRTTIVATVARGINEEWVGECIRLLFEKDFLLSVMFQPAAYTGTGSTFAPHDPLDVVTIPDVIALAEKDSGGVLHGSDFLPLPCSHPSCFALTYLLKTADGFVPFSRFLDLPKYLDLVANRGTLVPDEGFEGAMREAIDTLWSSSGQLPERDRVLATLKRALRLMYPEEKVLEMEERLQIGEGLVKSIFIHAFMDPYTFEIERIKRCCTHYALPDGRLMPGCAHNQFHRAGIRRTADGERARSG